MAAAVGRGRSLLTAEASSAISSPASLSHRRLGAAIPWKVPLVTTSDQAGRRRRRASATGGGPLRWTGRDCDRQPPDGASPTSVATRGVAAPFAPEPGATRVDVPLGRRVVVVANLLLTPEATPATTAPPSGLARALDAWEGPGVVVIAGNLFDLTGATRRTTSRPVDGGPSRAAGCPRPVPGRGGAAGHPPAGDARPGSTPTRERRDRRPGLERWAGRPAPGDRRGPGGPGRRRASTSTRPVAAARRPTRSRRPMPSRAPWPLPRPTRWRSLAAQSAEPRGRTGSTAGGPGQHARFLTSRLLYRRLRHAARGGCSSPSPWPRSCGCRDPLGARPPRLRAPGPGHPPRPRGRPGGPILVAALVCAGRAGRPRRRARAAGRAWRRSSAAGPRRGAVGGRGPTTPPATPPADCSVEHGYAGLVTGATFQAELTHLGPGFFACVGRGGEVVEEHRGRLGLPPVFLQKQWPGSSSRPAPSSTSACCWPGRELAAQRPRALVARGRHPSMHPSLVAPPTRRGVVAARPRPERAHAAPGGSGDGRRVPSSWPASIDLLDAVTPPLRGRLHLVLELLPSGPARPPGRWSPWPGSACWPWPGASGGASGGPACRGRASWPAPSSSTSSPGPTSRTRCSPWPSWSFCWSGGGTSGPRRTGPRCARRSSPSGVGVVGITVAHHRLVELSPHRPRPAHPLPWWTARQAVLERLVGIHAVPLPDRLDDFLAPSLLAIGVVTGRGALFLATRPVVDRRLPRPGRRVPGPRHRPPPRHAPSTTSPCVSDKQWFFHRDSLVAYAIYGGICLVSPDPIGPRAEREQVWAAFRRFADDHGWVVSVMGAGEHWLPIYRATGMHDIYIGDEAVVRRPGVLPGGRQHEGTAPGLQPHRQVRVHGVVPRPEPARPAPRPAGALMAQSRRGEFERGFSMMLGPDLRPPRRRPAPVHGRPGPDGDAAAMCQFVPARGIDGYSLDLMRRDPGEHPNGLIDFALVSTIEHLRELGCQGLSLNFAALRSVLAGDGRRHRPAGGALGPQEDVELLADRIPVAVQRQVRARVAAPLRRVRRGRAPRPRGAGHLAGRVALRGPGDRTAAGGRGRETHAGRPAGDRVVHRLLLLRPGGRR